jgi:hypothetical protein
MRNIVRFAAAAAACTLIQGGAFAVTASQAAHGMLNTAAHLKVWNDSVQSSNWSGYGVQKTPGSKFTYVAGSWVEPTVTCSGGTQYSSFWVGIDGYSSDSVEQLGTDSDCHGTTPSYYAWWEMYPKASVSLSSSKYPVKPGDSLSAFVSVSGKKFTLSISSSRGWTFTTVKTGTSALKQSSAEWIAESPEVGGSLAKLADFGTMGFTSSTAEINGGANEPISSFTAKGGPHAITMVTSGGATRAAPSALNPSGNGFTVTWDHD